MIALIKLNLNILVIYFNLFLIEFDNSFHFFCFLLSLMYLRLKLCCVLDFSAKNLDWSVSCMWLGPPEFITEAFYWPLFVYFSAEEIIASAIWLCLRLFACIFYIRLGWSPANSLKDGFLFWLGIRVIFLILLDFYWVIWRRWTFFLSCIMKSRPLRLTLVLEMRWSTGLILDSTDCRPLNTYWRSGCCWLAFMYALPSCASYGVKRSSWWRLSPLKFSFVPIT